MDRTHEICVNKEYSLLYENDRPTRKEIEKYIEFMKNNPDSKYHLRIKGIRDIPTDLINEIINAGIDLKVAIMPHETILYQETEVEYDIAEFGAIRENLNILLSGIDSRKSEKEKFQEIYRRVCMAIDYDTQAAYPETPEEERYAKENIVRSRNLRNGLLMGRCVCAGYADILRNALDMYGIEAEYVEGEVLDNPITIEEYEKTKDSSRNKNKSVFSQEGGMVTLSEGHAWVKVKLDGKWYNCDPTWDVDKLNAEENPEYCLLTDKEISSQKDTKRELITGPECIDEFPRDEIAKMFAREESTITKIRNAIQKFWEKINSYTYTPLTLNEGESCPAPASKPKTTKRPSWDLANYDNSESKEEANISRKKEDDGDIER